MKSTHYENQSQALNYFDQIYIINLEIRTDRLEEVKEEFTKIGASITHPNITVFKAVKPTEHDGWPSAGAKGCFMSHLGILKDAQKNKYQRILVLEDDVEFTSDFNTRLDSLIAELKSVSWDIFYGGYGLVKNDKLAFVNTLSTQKTLKNLYLTPSDTQVICTHCIAFNKTIIPQLIKYLELMSARPAGDLNGGPMHVDGAFTWFRTQHPNVTTVLSYPEIANQRSSRTDIHDLTWVDNTPLIKNVTQILRKIKNKISVVN